jgi:hypothetical protein
MGVKGSSLNLLILVILDWNIVMEEEGQEEEEGNCVSDLQTILDELSIALIKMEGMEEDQEEEA